LPEDKNASDDGEKYSACNQIEFDKLHSQRWHIEQYHRTIKQVCIIESLQVRGKTTVKNHLFAAICGYQRLKAVDIISNCYKLRRELFNEMISSFIEVFAQGKEHLNPKFSGVVNA
jgi:Transposase DDE domain